MGYRTGVTSIAFLTYLTGSTHLNGHDVTLTPYNELLYKYPRVDLAWPHRQDPTSPLFNRRMSSWGSQI